jgi:hypothetical protein
MGVLVVSFFLMEVGVLTPDMCSFAVMDDVRTLDSLVKGLGNKVPMFLKKSVSEW